MTKETDSQTTFSIARDGRDIRVIPALIITLQSSTSRNKRYGQCGEMEGSIFLESFLFEMTMLNDYLEMKKIF